MALIMCLPVFMTELVIFCIAVTPATCNAENLTRKASTPDVIPLKLIPLLAALILSKPLEAPVKFSFCLSLSSVDILCATPFSNCWLSNRISKTLLSTVLLIP